MQVRNVHQRALAASPEQAAFLIDGLASREDHLWPTESWPPMRFDRPLQDGATGGDGPIRYTVASYEPGRRIEFAFTGPKGFNGRHRFEILRQAGSGTVLRHSIEMRTSGLALLSWPLVFRPLHDALVEDALSKAQASAGEAPQPAAWSTWVKLLRSVLARCRRRGR